jgi:Fungal specific transcription factor domain
VASLELKLQENGIHDPDLECTQRSVTVSTSTGASQVSGSRPVEMPARESLPLATDIGPDMAVNATSDRILNLVQRRCEPEPAFSKILLTELMRSKTAPHLTRSRPSDQALAETYLESDMFSDLDTSPMSLPTKEAAHNLVKAYFQFANLSMPLLHEPSFQQKLELLYSMSRVVSFTETHTNHESRIAVFFVFEVLAVALCVVQKQDPSRIPASLADRYHKTALIALREAGLPVGIEGVQALLLVGQYSYHHPTVWAVWKTIGAALRLAVELGLHQDAPSVELDFLTMDTMRRTFWVAYAMDRNVSIALAMPSCLSDGAITAKVCVTLVLRDQMLSIC